ncbi:MAG TPA: glycosyltransferase [Roseiarcus sp.]|nr:glycosyltransferase [Roseiarcus sp.]
MTPLISIAVPTRDRGRYLIHCLETALRCDPRKIEIVVSDNASADASFVNDPRFTTVKFVRQPQRIPLAANFDAAFAACSGEYIIYVGDDDAVIPSGIGDLVEVLERRRPDIVSWPEPHYFWPSAERRGSLTIKRRHLRGGVAERDPREIMRLVCAGLWGNNAVHCGCLRRKLVEQIRARCGRYFYHLNPDAAAYGALAIAQSYFYLNRPVTLYGRSPASNTTAFASPDSAVHKMWLAENASEVKADNLDVESRSVAAGALDGLLTTVRLLGTSEPSVDVARWKARIADDLARMPEAKRREQLDLVNAWLGKIGQSPVSLGDPVSASYAAPHKWRRPSLGKVELAATLAFLSNSAAAVDIVEYLVGPGSLAQREPWFAATARWARLMARAGLLSLRAAPDRRERAAA